MNYEDHDYKWDAERIRTYKCGTHPKVGDLVIGQILKQGSFTKENCYGIVTGKLKLATGLVMPVILWCGHGKPKRCISKNVELVVRNENNV